MLFPPITPSTSVELNLPKRPNWGDPQTPPLPKTPSEWFALKFPDAVSRYGCPFLEVRQSSCDGFTRITPISLNHDFFAGMLGGDAKLCHKVIYYEPEMQFYYRDPIQNVFKPTTAEKLQAYYRAMMLRCAQELNGETDKLNLFSEFRCDKNARTVTNRAKSILAADASFFSASSPNQRIRGPELHERIARRFVDELLTAEPGNVLLLADAYAAYIKLVQQQNLETIKRSEFKAMVVPLVQDQFGICLRNDLVIDERSGIRGWKNVKLIQALPR